jgi:hypothetical protein
VNFSRRSAVVLGVAVLLALAAIPLTAYVIVPQFVRRTVVESVPVVPSPSPAQAGASPVSPSAVPATTTLATGDLRRISTVDFGTGKVSLLQADNRRYVRFDNVEIAGAPAQHVYLSDRQDGQPGRFTDLGPLKATNGSFNYEVPATVDLSQVHSVVSWCTQFNTTVTFAVLHPV